MTPTPKRAKAESAAVFLCALLLSCLSLWFLWKDGFLTEQMTDWRSPAMMAELLAVFKVTPGKSVKTGNVVKPTEKASQVQVVRIDCRLLDNNVIDPGSITIYARITTANNRVLCNGAAENYSFDYNGTPMQYTTKQDIEFTGYGRAISMLWRKGESVEMAPGLYWVTLYANGYEIGKTSFRLN